MTDHQTFDYAAMLRAASAMVSSLLENSPPEIQEAVSGAMNAGASVQVRIGVLPRPLLQIVLREHEGRELQLCEILLEPNTGRVLN